MDCEVLRPDAARIVVTVAGTGVAMTAVVLTVLLTAMTRQHRALLARLDEADRSFAAHVEASIAALHARPGDRRAAQPHRRDGRADRHVEAGRVR